jgi:hypothetical protein
MRILVSVAIDERRPLEGVSRLCRESLRLEKALTELVLSARRQGHTWTEIGRALSVTRQAAWRRFAGGVFAERFVDLNTRRG